MKHLLITSALLCALIPAVTGAAEYCPKTMAYTMNTGALSLNTKDFFKPVTKKYSAYTSTNEFSRAWCKENPIQQIYDVNDLACFDPRVSECFKYDTMLPQGNRAKVVEKIIPGEANKYTENTKTRMERIEKIKSKEIFIPNLTQCDKKFIALLNDITAPKVNNKADYNEFEFNKKMFYALDRAGFDEKTIEDTFLKLHPSLGYGEDKIKINVSQYGQHKKIRQLIEKIKHGTEGNIYSNAA